MLAEVLLALFVVIATLVLLVVFIPFTSYGWTHLLFNSSSNILVIPVTEARQSENSFLHFLGIVFILIIILALPFLAKLEEDLFRRGKIKLKEISISSVKFGLIHLVAGVPLAAGLALINAGFFYAYVYRRRYNSLKNDFIANHSFGKEIIQKLLPLGIFADAVEKWEEEAILEATAYHTLYNTILMLLLILTFFV